jgi:predicted  nucleic acid-binding Zn-ribbon protein
MKRLFLFVFAVCITALVWARPISREQALRQAQQFFLQKGKSSVLVQAETQMTKTRSGGKQIPDYYYVFNAGNNQGFVIVSGDDRTPQILGYSDHGSFNFDQIPSNMSVWLEGYAEQIKYVQDHQIENANRTRTIRRASVAPLLTSHWDQHSPFNDDCAFDLPSTGRVDAVTGCVSTAMAQVMYYYKYPAQTKDTIPSYQVTYNRTDLHKFDSIPAGAVIDWANMLDYYPETPEPGTEVQRAAVANLLAMVGKSIQTVYSSSSSGAQNGKVADALKKYFGYAQTVTYRQRWGYTNDEWEAILYQELTSGRPIIYGGQTSDDSATKQGHAFVLDGYDDNGFFHVNWGWGQLHQSPDGYFLLSAMDPPVEGSGGGSGAYNYGQDAIVGIDYKDAGPITETVRLATTALTVNGGTEALTIPKTQSFTVAYNVMSRLMNTYNVQLSLGLYKDDSLIKQVGVKYAVSNYSPNGYTDNVPFTLTMSDLQPGQYKIIPISQKAKTEVWYQNERSDEFYILLEVSETQIKIALGQVLLFEAAKKDVQTSIDELKTSLTDANDRITKGEAALAELSTAIEKSNETLASLKKKSVEIDSLMTSSSANVLSEEQIAAFKVQLQELNAKNEEFTQQLAALTEEEGGLKVKIAEAQASVKDAETGIGNMEKSLSEATTLDEVKDLNKKMDDLKKILEDIDVAVTQVVTDIATQTTVLLTFVTDASTAASNADAFYDEVQNTISGIDSVMLDEGGISRRYDLNGRRVDDNHKGVMIIKMNNGKTRTIIHRDRE